MLQRIKSFLKRNHKNLILSGLLFFGFLVRIYFVDKFIIVSGDLLLYADWGQKFWEYGSKNFYYVADWYYAPPNYPPIISLIYAYSYWLYDHKYVLAQIHNIVKFYPSEFIDYFYKNGYYLTLKLPSIIADLAIGIFIYRIILSITNSYKRSLFALSIYLFNPVSILLSSIWGQTDSLIAIIALLSFYLLAKKHFAASVILYFLSLYIKPNWLYLLPLYVYLFVKSKPKLREIIVGGVLTLTLFIISTLPFSKEGVLNFSIWLWRDRLFPTAFVAHKASVGAFNTYAALFKLDYTPDDISVLGIPVKIISYFIYSLTLLGLVVYLRRSKFKWESSLSAIFVLGFGVYLFFTNMLERYFFAAFVPLIMLAILKPKIFKYMILINIAVFANLFFSFFRRKYEFIADVFHANNYLLIRIFSLINLFSWFMILKHLRISNKLHHDK